MRAVVQRVKESRVIVEGRLVGEINRGFNVLLGIAKDDTIEDLKYIKDNAMGGDEAKALYEEFVKMLKESDLKVETGEFGAHMNVEIENDGPVTILLDSKKEF